VIVRCTARLLKLLAPHDVVDVPPAADDWYANLIWIDRRKCLLTVHADTLFPFFVADVRKPQLAKFGPYLAAEVTTALADEGLEPNRLGPLDPASVRLARTASRSVLGFMNDMASTAEHISHRSGGVRHLDVDELNALLRRTPYHRGGYFRPLDAAREHREAGLQDIYHP
jgi:hypothetical protein